MGLMGITGPFLPITSLQVKLLLPYASMARVTVQVGFLGPLLTSSTQIIWHRPLLNRVAGGKPPGTWVYVTRLDFFPAWLQGRATVTIIWGT